MNTYIQLSSTVGMNRNICVGLLFLVPIFDLFNYLSDNLTFCRFQTRISSSAWFYCWRIWSILRLPKNSTHVTCLFIITCRAIHQPSASNSISAISTGNQSLKVHVYMYMVHVSIGAWTSKTVYHYSIVYRSIIITSIWMESGVSDNK